MKVPVPKTMEDASRCAPPTTGSLLVHVSLASGLQAMGRVVRTLMSAVKALQAVARSAQTWIRERQEHLTLVVVRKGLRLTPQIRQGKAVRQCRA
mmetsp:Transcript_2573/g.16767  ORF Transcript_2573/g.16767 Transcript_2573/m.16767 type:complete len:95 (+) Transcript_2573:1527-1811(+)